MLPINYFKVKKDPMEYWCVVGNWLIGCGGHLAIFSRLFADVLLVLILPIMGVVVVA